MAPPPRANAECVKVVVRCRPLSSKEIQDGRQRIVDMDTKSGQVIVKNPKLDFKEPPKMFTFDQVYDWDSTQKQIYEDTARPIVESVIKGYNGTIFAYGQTGTGKTHTMDGKDEPDLRGIIPNAFEHIFSEIASSENTEFLVRVSFLEIYNEEIRDLLAKHPSNKLELKESVDSGVYVRDLTSFVVKGVVEIRNVLQVGKKNRSVGATLMNQDSSRSHSIFTITIETSSRTQGASPADSSHIRVGKLNLVDLAGSERQSKTGATGERFKELTNINWSLSALGNVISALVDGRSGHIPYRDSKLTRLLQDSLGGNTRTVMVANLGPADYNFDESVSTLRYANRAKNIRNKPRINEDPKDTMLREFQEEIARLRALVQHTPEQPQSPQMSEMALAEMREAMRAEMEEALRSRLTGEALAEKERTEDEKRRVAEELRAAHQAEMERHYAVLAQEKEERDSLAAKLKEMEDKLLHGTGEGEGGAEGEQESLVEKTERVEAVERELAEQQARLEETAALDAERQRKIAELEEAQLMAEEKYSSMAEELEGKSRKLKKLASKFQAAKDEVAGARAEIRDLSAEFQREREDLLDALRAMDQQLKLKALIIDHFIPAEEIAKIMRRAHWSHEHERWSVEQLAFSGRDRHLRRPASAGGGRRPVSEYAQIAAAMGDQNPRYRSENILTLALDMPERTTYDDYDGATGNARVKAALDRAIGDSAEALSQLPLSLDNLPNVYFTYEDAEPRPSSRSLSNEGAGRRPKSAKRRPAKDCRPQTAIR